MVHPSVTCFKQRQQDGVPPESKFSMADFFLLVASVVLLATVIVSVCSIRRLQLEVRELQDAIEAMKWDNRNAAGGQSTFERTRRDTEGDDVENSDSDSTSVPPPLKKYSDRFRGYSYSNDEVDENYPELRPFLRNPFRQKYRRPDSQERIARIKVLPSAHFSGDTSRYDMQLHDNFLGNGHLKHPRKTFVDWKANDWVSEGGMDEYFTLSDGKLTIKQSGLYFVYAQIYYLDEHDKNGFKVFKNNRTMLQCTITAHSSERRMKGNTCYTAGVEYLSEGDGIELRDLSEGRYSVFEPGMSFFGVIKLGEIKIN